MATTKAGVRAPSHHGDLYIRKVRSMGRGVFAGRAFKGGEIIEVCPVIPLVGVSDEAELGNGLQHYVFKWGPKDEGLALALGYGSLYNHGSDPNASFSLRLARNQIVFRALRAIAADEQVLVSYGWDEADYAKFRKTG